MSDPTYDDPPSYEDTICHRLGEIVILFNALAAYARHMLWGLGGKSKFSDILTSKMGEVSLCDALRTANNELNINTNTHSLIELYANQLARARQIRNYYVHGIILTLDWDKATIERIRATKQLIIYERNVDIGELSSVTSEMDDLRRFGSITLGCLVYPDGHKCETTELLASWQQRLLPLEERVKTLQYQQAHSPQPPSSQE